MNKERKLHIVCHDVPYPADYGGVFDLFYKIKSLYEEGIRIKLHCFSYGRSPQPELNEYCEEVNYYERKTGIRGFSFTQPYIVSSRANPQLLANLLKDDDPVLMEGIHCTAYLKQVMKKKKVILRLHNVEGLYYWELFKSENSPLKKLFFLTESTSLSKYEKKLPAGLLILAVSKKDAFYYKDSLGKKNVHFLPVFIPYTEITSAEGRGDFCLYHGNLSVPENEKAVRWLLGRVFSKTSFPFVIAGKNPSKRLSGLVRANPNARLVANPPDNILDDLIHKAQINILPSLNITGIKLKLIHALYQGRYCIANKAVVEGTGLETVCLVGSNSKTIATLINQTCNKPFTTEDINLRKQVLNSIFDNNKNVKELIQWIW